MSFSFNFSNILERIFNYSKGGFEPEKPHVQVDAKYPAPALNPKLKDVLGHLRRDLDIKAQRLRLALGAPVLVMSGGGERLEFLGQYGGGASASDYVAPDRVTEAVYSTARILARIFKDNESELVKALDDGVLTELQNRLVELHKKEKELFDAVYTLGELANLSAKDIQDMKTIDPSKRTAILQKIRDLHEAAEKDRKAIFVAVGMP
jgi:hypothetical protein